MKIAIIRVNKEWVLSDVSIAASIPILVNVAVGHSRIGIKIINLGPICCCISPQDTVGDCGGAHEAVAYPATIMLCCISGEDAVSYVRLGITVIYPSSAITTGLIAAENAVGYFQIGNVIIYPSTVSVSEVSDENTVFYGRMRTILIIYPAAFTVDAAFI